MPDYVEPTTAAMESAEQAVMDVLKTKASSVMTKAGSAVRELVVRPLAYLSSWSEANLARDLEHSSVAYLKTSQATENPIADAVASNYFVTRQSAVRSTGIVTMVLTVPTQRIAGGSRFSVDNTILLTPTQYFVTNTETTDVVPGITYLRSVAVQFEGATRYMVNVPVVAAAYGRIELPPGLDAEPQFSCPFVASTLTSGVTGGSEAETDASMMARAEMNTANAGVGSYYGLLKKLDKAPVKTYGLSVVAGEDAAAFRARYNNVNVSPGGVVDCHVKTANQPTTMMVEFDVEAGTTTGTYTGTITGSGVDGLISVDSLVGIEEFTVEYKSATAGISDRGARLSVDQKAVITFHSTTAVTSATANVTFMPGIAALQEYMDGDNERFVGQDVKVKAAIPVAVSMDCAVESQEELTEDELAAIKQAAADTINAIPVGTRSLNFSDIVKACATAVPKATLRLPCTLSASVFLEDGTRDTFHSVSGILDLGDNPSAGFWDYRLCFFSACVANIRVTAI